MSGQLSRFAPLLALAVVVCLAALGAGLVGGNALERIVIEVGIKLVFVVGLYIFVGNSGVLSFGHVGFMAVGAYAAAWVSVRPANKAISFPDLPAWIAGIDIPGIPADIVAGLAAALLALLFGIAILRLSGIAASIATFAMLAIVINVVSTWDGMTGGTSSIIGFRRTATLPSVAGWVLVALAIAFAYKNSRFGLSLRASRDDEVAARASGVKVMRERLIAFVISAFLVGVSGSLYASYLGSVNIQIFWLDLVFTTLVMLIVGGAGSVTGAVVGVASISIIVEAFRVFERGIDLFGVPLSVPSGTQEFGLAVLILVILIFRPRGLMRWREWEPFRSSRQADGPASTTDQARATQ